MTTSMDIAKASQLLLDIADKVTHLIDWNAARTAFECVATDKASFVELRGAIWARGTRSYLISVAAGRQKTKLAITQAQVTKYKDFTLEQAAKLQTLAAFTASKPNGQGQRNALEDDAFRSGRNAFDYMVKTARYVTLETRGGGNKGKGKGKRKPAGATNQTAPHAPTSAAPIVSDIPVTLPSVIVPKGKVAADVTAFYLSVKAFLVRAQAENATLFTGKRGNALLAAHNTFVKALAEVEAMKDE